jgi:hypothetical protein
MKKQILYVLMTVGMAIAGLNATAAEALDAAMQAKVDAKLKDIQAWAADPVIVNAVKAHNTSLPAESASMTQDKWKGLSVLDPAVRGFTKNEAAVFLKSKQAGAVTEAFLSGADGLKVAFLAKTSGWSHKGKEKHDVPMSGKTWQGPVETDESTGQRQLQVAVPVLDGGKRIGSLVVGLNPAKLE